MPTHLVPLARILAKTAALVVALQLAVFYLRLGWFWVPITIGGAALAPLTAIREIRTFRPRVAAVAFTLAAYAGLFAALENLLFGQQQRAVFEMTWQDRGSDNDFGRPEIVLEFVRFPGHHIAIYSNDVRDYLRAAGDRTVPVTFRITRDLGCLRGFSARRIGSLERWRSAFGYAGTTSDPPSPWKPDPWWCP